MDITCIDIEKLIRNLDDNSSKCYHKDIYTYQHNLRVKEYCMLIGEKINLTGEELEELSIAAEFHDIGKIDVDDSVLFKESPLTIDECNAIKKHTLYGYELLNKVVDEKIALGIKHHHERLDGSGYPEGLKGDEINFYARIIAVADSFDAMTTDRPYHKGIKFSEAMEELKLNKGISYEEDLINVLEEILIEQGLI